jgi:hypothetical protein
MLRNYFAGCALTRRPRDLPISTQLNLCSASLTPPLPPLMMAPASGALTTSVERVKREAGALAKRANPALPPQR